MSGKEAGKEVREAANNEIQQLREVANRLQREIDQLKEKNEQLEKKKGERTNIKNANGQKKDLASIRLLVPTFNRDKVNIRSWLNKFKNEAIECELNDKEMARQLSKYVDDETVNFVLMNEHLGFEILADKLIGLLENKNERELEEIMDKPYEYRFDIQQWVEEKKEAGDRLSLEPEKIMKKINKALPPKYLWVDRFDQLPKLCRAVREEKRLYSEQCRANRVEPKREFGTAMKRTFYSVGNANKRPAGRHCYYCSDNHGQMAYDHIAPNCPRRKEDEKK